MDKPYTFSSIVRLIDFIPIGDRENAVVTYINKFIDWCRNNGYNADVKVLEEHLKARCGEVVAMAVMDNEDEKILPIYKRKSLYSLKEENRLALYVERYDEIGKKSFDDITVEEMDEYEELGERIRELRKQIYRGEVITV